MAIKEIYKERLRVESTSHSVEDDLRIIVHAVNKPFKKKALVLRLEISDIDLLQVTSKILEDSPARSFISRKPLKCRPAQRLLVFPLLSERGRSGEGILGGVPHCALQRD